MASTTKALDKLKLDGFSVFEPDIVDSKRDALARLCAPLRVETERLLDTYRDAGQPEHVAFPTREYVTTDQRLGEGLLDLLQFERHRIEKFGRVGLDLTVASKPNPIDKEVHEANELIPIVRKLATEAGHKAAEMLGLPVVTAIQNEKTYERMQFLHVWYGPGGNLYGDHNHRKGHQDSLYTGMTFSVNIDPNSVAEWTVNGLRGRRKFKQTGNMVVAMTGKVNPYHLVEVPRKSKGREAVLFRVAGPYVLHMLNALKPSHTNA